MIPETEIRTAVVVAPSPVPLRTGGAERHWEALRDALDRRGIAADIVKLPVREHNLVDLADAYEQFALLDLSHADLVITGKYPAWMVQHPNHVVWMLHPLRGLYDTWNPAFADDDPALRASRSTRDLPSRLALLDALNAGPETVDAFELIDLVRALSDDLGPQSVEPGGALAVPGTLARAVVHHLDRWALDRPRIARYAAISKVVADRPGYFPSGVEVSVIHPPSCLPDPGDTGAPGDAFVTVARLDRPKRVDLAIEAMRRLDDPAARLLVVGDGPDRRRLEESAAGDPRIAFTGRVADTELADLYRSARAVLVTPLQEDFGYVAIEAMQHGRAVLTTTDAGGPAEQVTDGVDAIVAEPAPEALAEQLARLRSGRELADRLGANARRTALAHDWDSAIDRLLEGDAGAPPRPGRKGRLVAVSTYPVLGWPGGGSERAAHLLHALVERGWDVTVVCLSNQDAVGVEGPPRHLCIEDGMEQVTVALSSRHHEAETRLRRLTDNISVTDIAASVLWPSTPELARELRSALRGAAGVVAVQPYLVPAVRALGSSAPLVYDAHNHEHALKSQMLPDDEAGRWMLARVNEAESEAAVGAALVVAATEHDLAALATAHGLDPERIAVVPNGVDTTTVVFTSPQRRAEGRDRLLARYGAPAGVQHLALFVGSAHRPNIEAGRLLLEMAPELPDVLFVLAGRHTDQLAAPHVPANVRLAGEVAHSELAELLGAADVALNPMLSGGGSNLKLLQYFAAGAPVITTALGARGIADPAACSVVAQPSDFAAAIRESLREPNRDRVEAARRLVEHDFDWARLGGRFAELVERALRSDDDDDPTGDPNDASHHERPAPR